MSPAQKIRKALAERYCCEPDDIPTSMFEMESVACIVLRAAADEVVPHEERIRKGMRPGGIGSTTPTEWMQDQRLHSRRQLLAIAAELEAKADA
jgi:hypothetical protein